MSRPMQQRAAFLLLLAAGGGSFAQNVPIATNASDRFARLDVNHDGVLSRYEMDAEVVFAALDSDGDQSITPAELKPLLGPNATDASALDRVRLADRNVNDLLEESELTRATEMRFEWLDANHDGNVDQAELQARFGVKMVGGWP